MGCVFDSAVANPFVWHRRARRQEKGGCWNDVECGFVLSPNVYDPDLSVNKIAGFSNKSKCTIHHIL